MSHLKLLSSAVTGEQGSHGTSPGAPAWQVWEQLLGRIQVCQLPGVCAISTGKDLFRKLTQRALQDFQN